MWTDVSEVLEDPRGQEGAGEDTGREHLLRDVCASLRRANRKLCVTHGYENYPERVDSDVDAICVDPARIPRLLRQRGSSAVVVQAIEHEKDAFYYILHRRCTGGKPAFVALDVSADYRRNGRVFFDAKDFLESRRFLGDFDAPAFGVEFASYLTKKILKGHLGEEHASRLTRLYGEDPAGCRQWMERLFPEPEGQLVVEGAQSGDWEPVRERIVGLRRTMLRRTGRRDRLGVVWYRFDDLRRVVGRILRPTGLAVAFLGPDGSGKSTVIDAVERDLAPAFRRTAQYRMRPGLTKCENATPVTDPHGRPPWGLVLSVAKLASWCAHYTLGYALHVYPKLVRSTFVLFDRYYHDLLVDHARYRYGGPRWLACVVGRLLWRPHLIILLDAPAKVLLARKQEVSHGEIVRQRAAYLATIRGLPNGHVVDASQPLEEVLADVEGIILDHMAKRTARRLKVGGEDR